jgi:ketosteroid isomerase-like protein
LRIGGILPATMSEQNLELTKRLYEEFNAGGIEAVLPLFAPDVLAHAFPEWLEQSDYRGHDGLRELIAVWTENFDEFEFVIEEYRDLGESVLVLGETAGQIKGSNVPIRQPIGTIYSGFRDGTVGEMWNFLTWRQAIDAAVVA